MCVSVVAPLTCCQQRMWGMTDTLTIKKYDAVLRSSVSSPVDPDKEASP
jgi:hypothetical protein